MQPADYQPPLSRWSQTWRVLVVLLISGLAWGEVAIWQWKHDRAWFALDLVIGIVGFVLMFWRRERPVTVAVVTAVASAISGAVGGPATLALVSLATRRKWREIVPLAIVSLAASLIFNELNPASQDGFILMSTAIVSIIGVSIGWGLYIGSRRELLATLRDRADRAESEQFRRVEQARTAERGRIAREMHDVLAHRISMVSMHAGALNYRTDLTPEQIRDTASVIQENTHQALTELREVLGVLRDGPGDAAPELPQPSAGDIPDLIAEAQAAGMKVFYAPETDLSGLPDSVGRAIYRIVQEGLTNVRKHAPDTSIDIAITGNREEGLVVEVRNPLHIGDARLKSPESGLGLVGLSERAALVGGTLKHQITAERVFVLQAWLPWPA